MLKWFNCLNYQMRNSSPILNNDLYFWIIIRRTGFFKKCYQILNRSIDGHFFTKFVILWWYWSKWTVENFFVCWNIMIISWMLDFSTHWKFKMEFGLLPVWFDSLSCRFQQLNFFSRSSLDKVQNFFNLLQKIDI